MLPVKIVGLGKPLESSVFIRVGTALTLDVLIGNLKKAISQGIDAFGDDDTIKQVRDMLFKKGGFHVFGVTLKEGTVNRLVIGSDGVLEYFFLEIEDSQESFLEVKASDAFRNGSHKRMENLEGTSREPKKRRRSAETTTTFSGSSQRALSIDEARQLIDELGVAEHFIVKFLSFHMRARAKSGYPEHEDTAAVWYRTRYLTQLEDERFALPWDQASGMSPGEALERFYRDTEPEDKLLDLLALQFKFYEKGLGFSHILVDETHIRCGLCGKVRSLNEDACLSNFVSHMERKHKYKKNQDGFVQEKAHRLISGFLTAVDEVLPLPSPSKYPFAYVVVRMDQLLSSIGKRTGLPRHILDTFVEKNVVRGMSKDFIKDLEESNIPWEKVGEEQNSDVEKRRKRYDYLRKLDEKLSHLSIDELNLFLCQLSIVENKMEAVAVDKLTIECMKCKKMINLATISKKKPTEAKYSWTIFRHFHFKSCGVLTSSDN